MIVNGDIDKLDMITSGLTCNIITYGKETSMDYCATGISYDEKGNASFDVIKSGHTLGRITLTVGGEHNVWNALSAVATACLLDIPFAVIQKGLSAFHGTDRRFEYKGELNGITIIDDYAHHPTEIEATLTSAKHYPHREIWCVFQPHTYTRTKALFQEFAAALSHADHVILADIYAARETDTLGITSEQLAEAVKSEGGDAVYLSSFKNIEQYLLQHCQNGDLLITMGAGDVVNIGEELLK